MHEPALSDCPQPHVNPTRTPQNPERLRESTGTRRRRIPLGNKGIWSTCAYSEVYRPGFLNRVPQVRILPRALEETLVGKGSPLESVGWRWPEIGLNPTRRAGLERTQPPWGLDSGVITLADGEVMSLTSDNFNYRTMTDQ